MSDDNLTLTIAGTLHDVPSKVRKAFASGSWPIEESAMQEISEAIATDILKRFSLNAVQEAISDLNPPLS